MDDFDLGDLDDLAGDGEHADDDPASDLENDLDGLAPEQEEQEDEAIPEASETHWVGGLVGEAVGCG